MDTYLRVIDEAVETLEDRLTDAADCAETAAERRKVSDLLNRLARLINQTRAQLH